MALVQRLITVQIGLANGQFDGGGNSATLSGLRVSARITVPGGKTKSNLNAAIYGLPLSMMNQLSTVGTQLTSQAKNTITVMAGDAQSGMAQVYQGTLFRAYVDAQGMPQVSLRVEGIAGLYESVMPTAPISMQGSADVATMFGQIAQTMGLQFENNGVSTQLSNPYLPSSPWLQASTLAEHAGINMLVDNGTLAIWKPGQARQGSPTLISPQTGMVGYPIFSQPNIFVKTVFDPTIKYGGQIQVQSDLTSACGTYVVSNLALELDSMVPHGAWFATIEGVPMNVGNIEP